MTQLNQISDNPGAHKARRRIGRGIGSGRGKTSGKGVKGQKARTGVSINGFEGGQMPIHRRVPKRGFNNISGQVFAEITLGRLQKAIDAGKIDASKPVTLEVLKASGVVRHLRDGVRLIATGTLKAKVALEITGGSRAAIEAVEKAGGSVKVAILAKADRPVVESNSIRARKQRAAGKTA
ncbi:MAG TPA: 50S ribosomal protein L15 [Alphaproteobacteria bacterium]|nr:50S ribosomal protein L15 [Alphaproteobacteria bacterium]